MTRLRLWDYENAAGNKIEFKGPILSEEGNFVPVAYDHVRAQGLVSSVSEEISQAVVDKMVVDTFGFDSVEAAFITSEVQALSQTTSIIIQIR